MALSQNTLRNLWGPRCQGISAKIKLHGAGSVIVRPTAIAAVLALNAWLVYFNYKTRKNDTGGYNCRLVAGTSTWSLHAYGICLDMNWLTNPIGSYLKTDYPSAMIRAIKGIRTNNGKQVWSWGGGWSGNKDCLTGDTELITRDGPVPIRDLVGQTIELLSTTNDPTVSNMVESEWVKAPIRSFGWHPTYEVSLSRRGIRTIIRTTDNHRWPVKSKEGNVRFVTTGELLVGHKIPAITYPAQETVELDERSVVRGMVWGDGSVYNKHGGGRKPQAALQLCGEKAELKDLADPYVRYWRDNEHGIIGRGLDPALKSLPLSGAPQDIVNGFFAGWFATDGCISSRGNCSLSTSDPEALTWIKREAPSLGLTITAVSIQPAGMSGFNSTKDSYSVGLRCIDERLLIRSKHKGKQMPEDRPLFMWKVESVETTGNVEEVFCPTIEGRNVVAINTPSVPLLTGQSMHWEIACSPSDLATGIDPRTLPFGSAAGTVPISNTTTPPAIPTPPKSPEKREKMRFVKRENSNAIYAWSGIELVHIPTTAVLTNLRNIEKIFGASDNEVNVITLDAATFDTLKRI